MSSMDNNKLKQRQNTVKRKDIDFIWLKIKIKGPIIEL